MRPVVAFSIIVLAYFLIFTSLNSFFKAEELQCFCNKENYTLKTINSYMAFCSKNKTQNVIFFHCEVEIPIYNLFCYNFNGNILELGLGTKKQLF